MGESSLASILWWYDSTPIMCWQILRHRQNFTSCDIETPSDSGMICVQTLKCSFNSLSYTHLPSTKTFLWSSSQYMIRSTYHCLELHLTNSTISATTFRIPLHLMWVMTGNFPLAMVISHAIKAINPWKRMIQHLLSPAGYGVLVVSWNINSFLLDRLKTRDLLLWKNFHVESPVLALCEDKFLVSLGMEWNLDMDFLDMLMDGEQRNQNICFSEILIHGTWAIWNHRNHIIFKNDGTNRQQCISMFRYYFIL